MNNTIKGSKCKTYEFLLTKGSELFPNFDPVSIQNPHPMKNFITPNVLLTSVVLLFTTTFFSQENFEVKFSASAQEISNYEKLRELGYSEKEIFQDLGNANFLLEKYEKAAFWYKKLVDLEPRGAIGSNYLKRYRFALEQTSGANDMLADNRNWLDQIREDYQLKRDFEARKSKLSTAEVHREFDFQPNLRSQSLDYLVEYERNKVFETEMRPGKRNRLEYPNYEEPTAVTADGKTAYFSKAVYMKPLKGVLSKKELVYKIYRTDKINGQWKNVREVALGPKYASVKHPAITKDGDRLFFASNMPGSFGDYDIYVADINSEGRTGPAKNLGTKVNTKKNDLYPSLIDGETLVFASEGREGYGGLDLYMTQVGRKKVGWATNLGNPINSNKDDFSMYLMAERGIGYVLSNRGKNKNKLQQVAFSYTSDRREDYNDEKEENLLNALNNKLKIDYTTTVFEDQ